MRYDQLLTLIDECKPKTIVEVGVAQGERAKVMVLRALQHRSDVHYVGYDVFETKNAAFHAAAFNKKKVAPVAECTRMMNDVTTAHPGFTFCFVIGDTRETLHGDRVMADLAFIDGDHRVEAIAGDYEALKGSRVVVLDDYYSADERGRPDTETVGCNRLVDRLNGAATILPAADPVRGGGRVQMVLVRP